MLRSGVLLRPDPARTVIRPFSFEDPDAFKVEGHPRPQRVVDRIRGLEGDWLDLMYSGTVAALTERHRDPEAVLMRRFEEINASAVDTSGVCEKQALLIGAYFSEEYSFEAAALFNPSMVPHPDQSGVADGRVRFVMSLRCIGEGHVSSLTFRTGTWGADTEIELDPLSDWAVAPRIDPKDPQDDEVTVHLHCGGSQAISETVIYPLIPSQHQGIEDVRLVRFVEDDGGIVYYGTYTAFSGSSVRQEMLRTTDFINFDMKAVSGSVSSSKGLALFPRRIDGRYMALGRQDSENLWLLSSDDLYHWDGGTKIVTPKWPWEFVQIGNCGSPMELDEGWLVLTHGVGTVRTYCIGACLLDKADPSKLLARTEIPLMRPRPDQRDGYVPNVVYSCGAMVHNRTLLLPYGVADDFTAFATAPIDDVLAAMD
ncbi:glycoside hydrolase family 130 protein [Sphingomonas profundi]|uniref:glycoside hydrolase family 130 protein n=1 Tax=Alterirhizorhabdus profundi TaxID=2681549 RepID=UPI001E507519|nr:glycoside hydrolase family 130 protein [Sphingomonas profundi]